MLGIRGKRPKKVQVQVRLSVVYKGGRASKNMQMYIHVNSETNSWAVNGAYSSFKFKFKFSSSTLKLERLLD